MASDKIELPRFSLAERDRRYAEVRREMAKRGIDCLIVPHNTGDWDSYQPDVRYLSQVGGGGSAASVVFPIKGEPVAFCREGGRTKFWQRAQDWVKEVRAPDHAIWSHGLAEAVHELGYAKSKIGIVGLSNVMREPEGVINHGEFLGLQKALPDATFENATEFLQEIRMRKSAEEIAVFEKAQVCADAVSAAIFETARVGVSDLEIYAAMMAAHIRNGGEVPTMMLMATGPEAQQTFLLPTHRKLELNDLVLTEADTKYMGYQGQSCEISCVGTPHADYDRCFDVSLESFNMILEAMKPGVPYGELVRLWEVHCEKAGVQPDGAIGHGLGLGQDRPRAMRKSDGEGFLVEEGHAFILKPSVRSADGKRKTRAGNVVVVEKGGARRLGKLEMKLRRFK